MTTNAGYSLTALALLWGCQSTPSETGAGSTSGGAGGAGGGVTVHPQACRADDDPSELIWGYNVSSCYDPVEFESPCLPGEVTVARTPRFAAPPLAWVECSPAAPGCLLRDDTNWSALMDEVFMNDVSVRRVSGGYRVGLRQQSHDHDGFDQRAIVYDATGEPEAVWRVLGGFEDACVPNVPMVTTDGAWFGVDAMLADRATYIRTTAASPDKAVKVLPFQKANQGVTASDDLYAMWGLGPVSIYVYDGKADQTYALGGGMPSLTEDSAFVGGLDESGAWHGYAWGRGATKLEDIVDVGVGQTLAVFGSDGTTLAWIAGTQDPRTPPTVIRDASMWTSPTATHKSALVATLRGTVADVAGPQDGTHARVNRGHLAYRGSDGRIHVYRLSDLRHWSFDAGGGFRIGYVDEDEVWLWTDHTLMRQQLAALGEGDPAG